MYQEIVLSSTFVKFLENIFDVPGGFGCLEKLMTEVIITDNRGEWLNEVQAYISNSTKKDILEQFIKLIVDKCIKKEIASIVPNSTFHDDRKLVREANLSLNTEDRVILRNEVNEIHKSILMNQYDIELIGVDNYINPDRNTRLLSSFDKKNIKEGEEFDFLNFIKPYVRTTQNVLVQDGYLSQENSGLKNLIDLLDMLPAGTNVKIITFSDAVRNRYRVNPDGIYIEQKLDEVKGKLNTLNIDIEFLENKIKHARIIKTDKYLIHLDRGLDFLYTSPRTLRTKAKETLITIVKNSEVN